MKIEIQQIPPLNQLLITTMLQYIGIKEVEGKDSEANIKDFVRCTFGELDYDYDSISWCSLILLYICEEVLGIESSHSAMARSWLSVGESISNPVAGDLVVFWRGSVDSKNGHVSIYLREDQNYIHCLGGNQSNEVKVSKYSKSRLLGYRRLRGLKG